MPSGGSSFWEEKTCNFGKLWYNHDTLGRDCDSAPGEGKRPDPCFDPYGISTQWTGQISVDLQTRQTPRKGRKAVIICEESYVNRSS